MPKMLTALASILWFISQHHRFEDGYHFLKFTLTHTYLVFSIFQVSIDICTFENNSATSAGGAAVFRNTALVKWFRSNVTNCRAQIGGGVLLTNKAGMEILGPDPLTPNAHEKSVFEGNVAIDGGGLMCALCGESFAC